MIKEEHVILYKAYFGVLMFLLVQQSPSLLLTGLS